MKPFLGTGLLLASLANALCDIVEPALALIEVSKED